jgi:D-alanine--poly(phosphoribitol) ligase subunit 1
VILRYPDGQVGELCLGGPQLAIGYYNDQERTAAAFTRDPVSTALSQRIYRTGDLVREVGGILLFAGRLDNQIKHLGHRIELEEIEAVLNASDEISQAAVVYIRRRDQIGRIVAYVSAASAENEISLRAELERTLPSYMIPSRIVFMPTLPKNANGKIDRAYLATLG